MRGANSITADDLVQLDPDHPGFRDAAYRARRNAIARVAMEYREGDPVPPVEYTADEQGVWRTVWEHLDELNVRPFQKLEGSRDSAFNKLDRPVLRALPAMRRS